MQLTKEYEPDLLIVTVTEDRLDAAAAVAFKDAMKAATRDAPRRVILDLEQVTFLDSSGLGAIVAVMKQLAPARQLEVAALHPNVMRVFRLTRMDSVIPVHPGRPRRKQDLPKVS